MTYTYIERRKILNKIIQCDDITKMVISYIPIPKFDMWNFKIVTEDIKNHKYCMNYELYDDESFIDRIQYISNFLRDTRRYFFYNDDDDDNDDAYDEILY